MPPDTANSANNDDTPPSYATENDLDFQMTPEQEQAFINETLGLNVPKEESNDVPGAESGNADDNNKEETPDTNTGDDTKDAKVETPEAPKVTPPVKEEEPPTSDVPLAVKTDDLWIEVEKVVIDDDGKETTQKVKLVYDPENPGSFVPDDFAFKSDKQLSEILEAKFEMANLYKDRKAEIDAKVAEKTQEETVAKTQEEQLKAWDDEIADLIESGVLEAPKVGPDDPKFKEDPTAQKLDAVFKYLAETNAKRAEEGKTPIRSFGTAFTMFEKAEALKVAEEAKKKDNEDAKKKASLIGGSSASGGTEVAAYKPGSYSNIYDVPIDV